MENKLNLGYIYRKEFAIFTLVNFICFKIRDILRLVNICHKLWLITASGNNCIQSVNSERELS